MLRREVEVTVHPKYAGVQHGAARCLDRLRAVALKKARQPRFWKSLQRAERCLMLDRPRPSFMVLSNRFTTKTVASHLYGLVCSLAFRFFVQGVGEREDADIWLR